jgi:hypothetical protein
MYRPCALAPRPIRFGIHNVDRLTYMYIIGKTGNGKFTLLLSMAAQGLGNR